MKWYDEIIRKAPPPYYRNENKYDHLQYKDIPGLTNLFKEGTFPLYDQMNMWKRGTVKAHEAKGNIYTPKISGRKNAIMFVSIYDFVKQEPKYPWQQGSLRNPSNPDVQTPDTNAISLARGDKSFTLTEDQIGITVIHEYNKLFLVNVYYGEDSKFHMYVNRLQTTGTADMDYDLTNGEVAALLIMAQMTNPKEYKERQRLFLDMGIGPLTRNTESKYIKTLVDKGFVDMNEYHNSPSMRGYPKVTAKGKAASNRFEMKHRKFHTEFRDVVKERPDEEFSMFDEGEDSQFGDEYQ